jgi:5'-nucleotidase
MKHTLQTISLIFLFLAIGCKQNEQAPVKITGERISIDGEIKTDSGIENFVKPYRDHINKTLDSSLAYNPRGLNKQDGELNTALGNLMVDAMVEQANPIFKSRTGNEIDMGLLNFGGIRSGLDQGAVTARSAYGLMPFENEIVVAKLSGKKIQEMLSYLERAKTAHPVNGIEIKMDTNYRIISAKIKEQDIDPEASYFVATSDYLQQGGDNMNFFKDPEELYQLDYKLRNALIDYFTKIDTIQSKSDLRFTKE